MPGRILKPDLPATEPNIGVKKPAQLASPFALCALGVVTTREPRLASSMAGAQLTPLPSTLFHYQVDEMRRNLTLRNTDRLTGKLSLHVRSLGLKSQNLCATLSEDLLCPVSTPPPLTGGAGTAMELRLPCHCRGDSRPPPTFLSEQK